MGQGNNKQKHGPRTIINIKNEINKNVNYIIFVLF